jgi:hypothetical protein
VLRVPPGSAGVVVVDGVVARVLPPGQQTAISLFERIAGFFSGRSERTSLYLVDLRPLPIPFTVRTRLGAGGRRLETQVLVCFRVDRSDPARLAVFLENTVGARTSYRAVDLFQLLRPEVAQIATGILERVREDPRERAEVEIRRELAERIGARWGLLADVSVAPLAATTTIDLVLGRGGRETDEPLVSGDGLRTAFDLVVRVRGPVSAIDHGALARVLAQAARAHTRSLAFAALATPASFAALEAALTAKAEPVVTSLGLELVRIDVVDVRSSAGDWILEARAELAQARAESALGREWVTQRAEEVDVLGLTLTQELARLRTERDAKLGRRRLAIEEARAEASARREDDLTALDHGAAVAERQRALDAASRRHAIALGSESARAMADEHAYAADRDQARQIEKLRAMAEIDRALAADEHAQTKELREQLKDLDERRILALQAAALAKSEGGGAAWASALAADGRLDQVERHAAAMQALHERSIDAMARVAASRAEPAAILRACPACGGAAPAGFAFCGGCGKELAR